MNNEIKTARVVAQYRGKYRVLGESGEAWAEVAGKIIFAAKEEAAKNNLKGYKLVFNVGRAGGQLIDHLHLHLLGGWTEGVAQSLNV